jgi:hypothetical protein
MLLLSLLIGCPGGTEVPLEDALAAGLRCEGMVSMAAAVFHPDGSLDLDGGTAGQGRGSWSLDGDRLTLLGSVHDPHADRHDVGLAPTPAETVFREVRLLDDEGELTLRYDGGRASCR